MIVECNGYVHAMVSAIKRLYVAYMTNSTLLETLRLEHMADSKLQECDLLCALETWYDEERDVEEVYNDSRDSATVVLVFLT
jgi:hypothetical protein